MSHKYVSRKREKFLAREKSALKQLAIHNVKKVKKKKSKRKTPDDMLKIVKHIKVSKFIRDYTTWKSKSFNINRQIEDFVKHIYCLYPVPRFMFEIFFDKTTLDMVDSNIKFKWFHTISSGGSFNKCVKDYLTKKEAHMFLEAPDDNTIDENLWWAKCMMLNLSSKLTHAIIKRFLVHESIKSPFWNSLLLLLKNDEDNVNIDNLSDVMDCLVAKINENENFNLKGRTFNSLIKLSNKWHRDMQMKKFGSQNLRWPGIEIQDWKFKTKQSKIVYTIKQLKSSKELYYEGRKQKHCVSSYGGRCAAGDSFIFTLDSSVVASITEKHLTIEINKNKELIQARARQNKEVRGEPRDIFRKWLRINNIKEQFGYY